MLKLFSKQRLQILRDASNEILNSHQVLID